jgi:hypothetical protein
MFEQGDKVIYIGEANPYRLMWTNGSYPSTITIHKYNQYTVDSAMFGTGMTFVRIKELEGMFSGRDFCYPNDSRLRRMKLMKIINKYDK